MTDSMNTAGNPQFSLSRVLAVLLPLALLIGGGVWYWTQQTEAAARQENERIVRQKLGLGDSNKPVPKLLAAEFTDANGDLVADAPTDAAKLVEPATLVFSYIGAEDSARQKQVWQEFTAAVAAATGKQVDYLVLNTPEEQLAAFKNGKLHLTAFNTGNVPAAVREAGFVPDVTLADAAGKSGHTMKFLVPAASKINKPEDLRGQRIALVNRRSNSGYKAPIVWLTKDCGLEPVRDFEVLFTFSHDESIAGIARGEYSSAPVASDMLARAEARGEIKPEQYRVLYESEQFPSVALGHAYNLNPELVAKIQGVYRDFVWTGTGLEKEFGPSGIVKFAPADYKQQWSLIRRIDDALGPDPAKIEGPEIPEEKMELESLPPEKLAE